MEFLIYLSMVLLMGVLASTLARYLQVSNIFFLILTGMILGSLNLVQFDDNLLQIISTLTLILVVFECSDAIRFKEFLKFIKPALKLTIIFFIINLILLGLGSLWAFDELTVLGAIILAALMYGIDPVVAISSMGKTKNKLIEILEIESVLNTPITVIIPLVLIKLLQQGSDLNFLSSLKSQGALLFQQVSIGIVLGAVVGIMMVQIMKKSYLGDLSHLAVITSATIAYVASEMMNGSGVLAVTVFGLIFGNLHPDHKVGLQKFASVFSNTLLILVFIMLGIQIKIAPQYILAGTLLFLVHLLSRFIAARISLPHLRIKQVIYATLNLPKGVDVAVIILLIGSTYAQLPGMDLVINVGLLFILYSITLSTVNCAILSSWASDKELKHKQEHIHD